MKFNYEFEFDVDEFVEYVEEDFFEYTKERTFYKESDDKEWITDKLYDWCVDTVCPSFFIISKDIDDNTKKYCPQIIDRAYEILKEKKKTREAFKVHLKAIKEFCKNYYDVKQVNNGCLNCPLSDYCGTFINRWEL